MIVFNKENRVFTLHTRNTTYQMKADWHNILLHTYYGPRVSGGDLSYLIQYADRGFSPNPNEVGDKRDYSLDTLPQEYSSCGVGDFRIPSIEFEPEDGSRLADLRYAGHELYRGKYKLEGLPAFWGGQEWETLVICMKDAAAKMSVELYYRLIGITACWRKKTSLPEPSGWSTRESAPSACSAAPPCAWISKGMTLTSSPLTAATPWSAVQTGRPCGPAFRV